MPGSARHRFYFEGREPFIVAVLTGLLFGNTVLGLSSNAWVKYVRQPASATLPACDALTAGGMAYHAPPLICWYVARFMGIQFVLLALLAAAFLIYRKRVRYVDMWK